MQLLVREGVQLPSVLSLDANPACSYTAAVRTRELALMASAYSYVSISAVSKRVGLPEVETIQLCRGSGWQADTRSGMLQAPAKGQATAGDDFTDPASLKAATAALKGLLTTAVVLEGASAVNGTS